ncbi:MAG: hypothetical protein LBV43_09005 [Prevotella sp.]|nr:hypothetical protein [Prevotella sp.]
MNLVHVMLSSGSGSGSGSGDDDGDGSGSGSGSGSGKTYTIKVGTCGAYLPMSQGNGSGIGLYFPSVGNYSDGYVTGQHGGLLSVGPSTTIWRGIDMESAKGMTAGISGAKWCCDSCDQSSWY